MVLNTLLKNKKVEHIQVKANRSKNSNQPLTLQKKLQTILSDRKDIESVFFYPRVPVADYNLKHVKNIHFFHTGEIYHDKYFYIPTNLNKEQNFYIHIDDPSQHIIEEYQNIAPVNFKIVPTSIGRCYSMCLFDRVKFTQNVVNTEKYKKLKNFKNILYYGKMHFGRKETLDVIKKITKREIKEVHIDFNNQALIDIMIENECFCVLSLDGSVNQCFRDMEIGLSKVFNLKLTRALFDISANGGIYISHTPDELMYKIQQIENDINNEDYTMLNKAFAFFSSTTNIFNITKPFVYTDHMQHYSLQQIEALTISLSLNINDLLLSANNIKTFEEWKLCVDTFFNV